METLLRLLILSVSLVGVLVRAFVAVVGDQIVEALWENCGRLVGEMIYRVVMSKCLTGGSDLRQGQNYSCGAPRMQRKRLWGTQHCSISISALYQCQLGFSFHRQQSDYLSQRSPKRMVQIEGKQNNDEKVQLQKTFFTLPYSPSRRPSLSFPPKT